MICDGDGPFMKFNNIFILTGISQELYCREEKRPVSDCDRYVKLNLCDGYVKINLLINKTRGL